MPVPMLLQRALVWGRTRFQPKVEICGITLVEHPGFDTRVLQDSIVAALDIIAKVDISKKEAVTDNIRMIIVTDKLKDVLAPYGAAFLPGSSPVWQNLRNLGGWLVWVAAYVAASKEFRLTRRTVATAAARAQSAREDFYHAYDSIVGRAP